MSTPDIVTASVAACASGVTLTLLLGAVLGGNLKEKIYRSFFAMLIFNLAGSCCELLLPFLYGTPGKTVSVLIRAIDFINYTCGCIVFVFFAVYLYEFLSGKGNLSKTPFVMMACIYSLNIPLIAVSQIYQIFVRLDENNFYYAQNIMWLTIVCPVISVAIAIAITLRSIKPQALKKKEWISLLLYVLIPFLCYFVEIMLPGVWIAYMGSTVALLLVYINIQVELKYLLSKKEAELTESRIDIMLSQIQPHFLYNTLGAIDKLYFENTEEGHSAIVKFSNYLRSNMDSITNKKPVQFSEELAHVKQYLWLEKLRFEENLQVFYEIETEAFCVPVLSLQPIVENAVRRGVTKKAGGGSVTVRTAELAHCFKIEVLDDGVGFDPDAVLQEGRSHVGIANVRERLRSMCNGTLTIQSEPGKGTVATIEIPKWEASK